MSSQRNDSEYSGPQLTEALGDHDHAGNSEFEKHDPKTDAMGNPLDPNIQPMGEYATTDSYNIFFEDAVLAINTEMEKYCLNLERMEDKEAHLQSEIVSKTEEMKKLSRILCGKRDSALQAIGQLTSNRNAQN